MKKKMQTYLKGYRTPGAFLKTLCICSKQNAQSIRWIWSEMFQGTQKS